MIVRSVAKRFDRLFKFASAKFDELAGNGGWRPDVRVTFHGQQVFAGIREHVEAGIVDGEKMPG